MQPVNTKSLFAFICDQMDKLANKEITVEEAKAQSGMVKQAHNLLKYELERAKTNIEVRDFNVRTGANIEIRQIEPKGFDDTTNQR